MAGPGSCVCVFSAAERSVTNRSPWEPIQPVHQRLVQRLAHVAVQIGRQLRVAVVCRTSWSRF
jgi:hypothetical protein